MSRAVARFEEAARRRGLELEIRRFPEGTKTAQDAALAVGCEVGQIVKSLVFMADGRPVLALTSGANRADPARLGAFLGAAEVRRATADEARAATGFSIGGTPPLGNTGLRSVIVDETLMEHDELWAAAGTPDAVCRLTPAELVRLSGGTVAAFAE